MYLREYATVLRRDWSALVSGSASIVLAVWAALFTPESAAIRKSLWISFAVCLFVASYRTWSAEHAKYLDEEAKNKKPDLKGDFHQVYVEPVSFNIDNDDEIVFYVTIELSFGNRRGKTTSVRKFSLRLSTASGKYIGENIPLRVTYEGEGPCGHAFYSSIAEWELPQSPEPHGYVEGRVITNKWLRFKVCGITLDDLTQQSKTFEPPALHEIVLIAEDIDGNEHEIL